MTTRQRGFTLIELLIVVTIIAILTGVAMVSFSAAGRGARDARRKADLETIRQALVMYRSEFGCYPGEIRIVVSSEDNFMVDTLAELQRTGYISQPLPKDPKGGTDAAPLYIYNPSGSNVDCTNEANEGVSGFSISAQLENTNPSTYSLESP